MKNGVCPKCGGNKIIKIPNESGRQSSYILLGVLATVAITRYVCSQCGFCEEWVDSQEAIEKLMEKYETL